MKPPELLIEKVKSALPEAKVLFDAPPSDKPKAGWWLDFSLGGNSVAVLWRPGQPFGIGSEPSGGYGDGPDEVYPHPAAAAARIVELLRGGEKTQPPEVALGRLRQIRRRTQVRWRRLCTFSKPPFQSSSRARTYTSARWKKW